MNILVIDVGTSSMRGILFDEKGTRLAIHQVKYTPTTCPDGRIEQSPGDWTGSLVTICRAVVGQAEKEGAAVDGIAITAQRSAILPVDRQGQPLMNTIMWQDRRNAEICRELEPHGAMIFEKSGAAINTVFSGSRMTWIARNCPELRDRLYKYVNIPEYMIHAMTGMYHSDVTYGSRSHLMNLRQRQWDPELLALFEVSEDQLCTLFRPGDTVGTLTLDFARETGLPAGIPVISAGGDQQCAAVGQGAFQQGTLSLVAGTGGFLVAAIDQVAEEMSDRMICNCSSVRDGYMVEANVLTCCSAFDWFCRSFYDWPQGQVDYDRINRELETLDGRVATPLVLPYFQGRSTPEWNPGARAMFGEISLGTTRKELLKALLEGICMELQNNIRVFAENGEITRAFISGGLTNSPVINQLQADVYGIPLYHMADSESTAIGALMTALVGLGVYDSFETAFRVMREGTPIRCYQPRPRLHRLYEEKRQRMNDLYNRTR